MTVEELRQELGKYPPTMDVVIHETGDSDYFPVESVSAKIINLSEWEDGSISYNTRRRDSVYGRRVKLIVLTDEI